MLIPCPGGQLDLRLVHVSESKTVQVKQKLGSASILVGLLRLPDDACNDPMSGLVSRPAGASMWLFGLGNGNTVSRRSIQLRQEPNVYASLSAVYVSCSLQYLFKACLSLKFYAIILTCA